MTSRRLLNASGWWLFLPVLLAWALSSAYGYRGLNGQDAYDYLRIANGWLAWAHGGPMPLMQEHPHGYPIAGALIGALFGSSALGLQLLSVAAMLVVLRALRGVLIGLGGREPVNGYLLLTVALSPFLLRHSLVAMSDAAAIALLVGAFAMHIRFKSAPSLLNFMLLVIFLLLAILFRLAAVPVVLVIIASTIVGFMSKRTVVTFGVVVITLALITSPWWWSAARLWTQHGPLAEWSPLNIFRTELHSDDGVLRYAWPNGVYVLAVFAHPGFIPIGALLLPFVRLGDFRSSAALTALLAVSAYLLFIAGMPFQNDRVLLLVQPFVALLLYPAFQRALGFAQARGFRQQLVIGGMAVVQLTLCFRAVLPFVRQAEVEHRIARELNGLAAKHIYTHGLGAALDELCPQAEITELWYAPIDTFQTGAFVVVDPVSLTAQWKGRPPEQNWSRVQEQGMVVVGRGPGDWLIARVL